MRIHVIYLQSIRNWMYMYPYSYICMDDLATSVSLIFPFKTLSHSLLYPTSSVLFVLCHIHSQISALIFWLGLFLCVFFSIQHSFLNGKCMAVQNLSSNLIICLQNQAANLWDNIYFCLEWMNTCIDVESGRKGATNLKNRK